MARKTWRDQLQASVQAATAKGAEHRAIVESLGTDAGFKDIPKGQDNGAGQDGKGTGQKGNKAEQKDTTTGQDNGAGQKSNAKWLDEEVGQKGRTKGQHERAGQNGSTSTPKDFVPVLLDTPEVARTPAQRCILNYFETHGSHVSNYVKIIKETGLTYNTARKSIDKLVACGMLSKSRWSQGSSRGLRFTFYGQTGQDNGAGQKSSSIDQYNRAGQWDGAKEQDNEAEQKSTPLKIDRKNLSFSLEVARVRWPQVLAAGFGPDQLDQVMASRDTEGKPAIDNGAIAEALDRAEWELDNKGGITDLKGQKPVSNIPGYLFKSLVAWGTFRPPPGYSLHEESELAELKRALDRKRKALAEKEDVEFEIWKLDQGEAGLEEAMKGFPGGNKDAWLRKYWREHGK